MADEIKVETETTQNTDAEPVQEQEPAQDEPEQIDYEAELKKEREAREKAEKALADKAFKERKEKRDDEEPFDEEEKPLTKKDLDSALQFERQQNQKLLQQQEIQNMARKIADSEAEASLIVEIHRNRTFPSNLSLEEQIEEAKLIANKKKILGQNSELKRALRGRDTVNDNPAATHRDPALAPEAKLSPQDAEAIKAAGYVWDGTKRLYKKTMPRGKFLYFDPKTKKRWTA